MFELEILNSTGHNFDEVEDENKLNPSTPIVFANSLNNYLLSSNPQADISNFHSEEIGASKLASSPIRKLNKFFLRAKAGN